MHMHKHTYMHVCTHTHIHTYSTHMQQVDMHTLKYAWNDSAAATVRGADPDAGNSARLFLST